MRRGLRLTPWTCSSEPGTRVAATMNGAAEEKSPGTSTSPSESRSAGRTVTLVDRTATSAPAACSMRSVWSRVGAGSTTVVSPSGEQPGEQDRRLDLRARDGQRVVDRVERAPGDRHRQVAVRRLEARAHAAERLGDPTHRPPRERLVARQLEALTVLSGEDAGDQADERPGVRAVDRPPRRAQPTEALPEHAERVGAVLVDVDPERAHRRDRRLGVRGAAEARDVRLAVADRADQHRAVRDRLVAGNRDVADEPRDRLDQERSESGGHSSITGAATTP